ncbi:hypothetical protein [Bradyrhizobium sp. ERR14]|uniref:hypothetical protein n=1 Tax=Bradyrhizobium sp. ERR14 TaxID=2663837 RepID=UPI00160761D9|nr:hypothetical protein [Bradyrhizobium sp. ERR14]MBB4391778.1 hypothetical protein [Bradyrhizobium sp. ERR14]
MPKFSMSHAHYRKAINACIAAVILVAVGQQFFHIDSWLVAVILASATALALGLRFFCSTSDNHQPTRVESSLEDKEAADVLKQLPAIIRSRSLATVWPKSDYTDLMALYVANLQVAASSELAAERDIADQLLSRLLSHRTIHQKIPQSERIRQVLLDEFAGYENPWMKDVPIGAVHLRIRGNFVELHVVPTRKQSAREEIAQSRKIFPDLSMARSVAH